MKSEWKKVSLKDIATVLSDGLHKAPEFINNGEYIFVNATNLENGYIVEKDTAKRTTYEEYLKYGVTLTDRTILYSIDGTIGNIARYRGEKCVLGKGACYINLKDIVDLDFIYYQLQSPDFNEYIHTMATGSTIRHISLKTMRDYSFYIPPITLQRRISKILKSLDDKIENNHKTCEKLEEIAQAIFKRWFVDFEFPNEEGLPYKSSGGEMVYCEELGKEIPKGWRIGTIGDYCSIKSGYAFKSSWWQEEGIPVIKIKGITNKSIDLSESSFVDITIAELASEFIVNGGDLLIAMTGATIGKFGIVPFVKPYAVVNQRVGKFFLGDDPYKKLGFIYSLLLQSDIYKEIVSRGEGSAQPNISPTSIMSIPILLPCTDLITAYNQFVEPLFRMNIKYQKENEQAQQIRDTLLPKLMSGELAVNEVEDVI